MNNTVKMTDAPDALLGKHPLQEDHMNNTVKLTDALLENYELQEEVTGKGSFGVVRRCFNKQTGQEAACKTIRKSEILIHPSIDKERCYNEIRMMQHVSGHPAVVSLHAAYEDEEYVHMVMDMCSGGDLFARIDSKKDTAPFSEEEAATIMQKLMEAISYCHSRGIAHRDIKPQNILFVNNSNSLDEIKLADFGYACAFSPGEEISEDPAGTASYMAPDFFKKKLHSEKVDVWSAGVTLYLMLSGEFPFEGKSNLDKYKAISFEQLQFRSDPWRSISQSAKDLISQMLSKDVTNRPSAHQVLEHPWITTPALRKPT